jgi:PAS domain S-box-containing protein
MQYTPYVWPLFIAAIFCAVVAIYARRFPDVPAVRPFAAMMWSSAGWAAIYGASLLATHLPVRIFLSMLMYIPTRLVPPFSLLLVLEYGGLERWITRRNLMILFAIPAIGMVASMTSPWHTLFRYGFRLETVGSLAVLRYKSGLIYWITTVYGNGLLLTSILLMLPQFRQSGLHRRNTALLFTGLATPTLLNIMFSAGLTPIKGYSFAPTMLVITGACYVFALLRYRLFGVGLVARSTVMENMADLVVVFDTRRHIVDFNAAAAAAFGLDRKKSIGDTPERLQPRLADIFERHPEDSVHSEEIELELADGRRCFDLRVSPLRDTKDRTVGRLFLFHDIGDLKAAEDTVKRLLEEKELLLHEVHHRIKNNMATMAGILSLQADTVSDPAAKAALLDARSRMQSMMVLYTKLYVTPAVGALDVELYLSPLIDKILSTFQNAGGVRVDKRFEEFVLDARTLFSLGLIVNELLTNAMKHAFVGRAEGTISVSISREGEAVRLEVADDGVGFPDTTDPKSSAGFGLNLVRILATQLRGSFSVENGGGARFVLRFAPPACPSGK